MRTGRPATSVAFVISALLSLSTGFAGCDFFGAPRPNLQPYQVLATLRENTCGAGLQPVEPEIRFRADLLLSAGRATWSIPRAGITAIGSYNDGTGVFRFVQQAEIVVRQADRRTGTPGCFVVRTDQIDGLARHAIMLPPAAGDAMAEATPAFDGGSALLDAYSDARPYDDVAHVFGDVAPADAGQPGTFEAVETVVYAVVEGSDCTAAVGPASGRFVVLPCLQRFALSGTRIEPGASDR